MNKIIISVALIALTSTAMVGSVYAKPGKPGGNQMQQPIPQINIQFQPGGKPGKGGQVYGGDATSPGDAFYPDSGDNTCDGVIKYQFDDAGVLVPVCLLF